MLRIKKSITENNQKEFMSKAEDFVDIVLKNCKAYLPLIARICLISTFIDDSIRTWFIWNTTIHFIEHSLSCGYFIANLLLFLNIFGQLMPCAFILMRKHVKPAVYTLFGVIFIQIIVKISLSNMFSIELRHFLKCISVAGGLIFLLVDFQLVHDRNLLAGVPRTGDENERAKNLMQLLGRFLLIIMFLTLIGTRNTIEYIIFYLIGLVLVILVATGYKTKASALTLVLFLVLFDLFGNAFWKYQSDPFIHAILKYTFFQTLSVIGGLLFIVILGPGGVSLDERKKRW